MPTKLVLRQTQLLTHSHFLWQFNDPGKLHSTQTGFPSQFCHFFCAWGALSSPLSLCIMLELAWVSSSGGNFEVLLLTTAF